MSAEAALLEVISAAQDIFQALKEHPPGSAAFTEKKAIYTQRMQDLQDRCNEIIATYERSQAPATLPDAQMRELVQRRDDLQTEVKKRNQVLLAQIRKLQELKIALNIFLSGNDLAAIAAVKT